MRTTFSTPAGVCRFCGCSELDACIVDDIIDVRGCSWIDASRRICSVCAPAARAEGLQLRTLRVAGYRYAADWVRAFHRGFQVGWFAISARSPYGRNPFFTSRTVEAWQLGHRAGEAARINYTRTCGAITNAPRTAFLAGGVRRQDTRRRRPRRLRA